MTQVVDYKRPARRTDQAKAKQAERNKRVVSVELPPEMASRIHQICRERNVKRSVIVREIFDVGLPIYLDRHGEA